MNDEFLSQFREPPEQAFSARLYGRLSSLGPGQFSLLPELSFTTRNTILLLLLVVVVAACAYAVANTRWHKIGDIWVDTRSTFDMGMMTYMSVPRTLTHWEGVEKVELSDASQKAGFPVAIPAWAPDGFTSDGQSLVRQGTPVYMSISWGDSNGGEPIYLGVQDREYWFSGLQREQTTPGVTWPVHPRSYKELQVNGQPAVLVKGNWIFPDIGTGSVLEPPATPMGEAKWDKDKGLSLYWTDAQGFYLLWTYNPSVTEQDLIRMAESAR